MKGEPWTIELEDRVGRIAGLYCMRCRQRWGIEMKPIVEWDEGKGLLTIGAEPVGPLDEAMLNEMIKREGADQ